MGEVSTNDEVWVFATFKHDFAYHNQTKQAKNKMPFFVSITEYLKLP